MISTVVPCTVFDNCEDEKTEQAADADHKNECSDHCPPFSICSSAYCFIDNSHPPAISPVTEYSPCLYGEYYFSPKSVYYPSFFQPPRNSTIM
jgi:hypothetical protein